MSTTFPADFVWGASTASYQIEGAAREGGRGESIWDRFSHTPGKIENGDNGDVAADHYHRWRSDIELMRDLGLKAYRFSVSWPRVLPRGFGKPEPRGLDFYSQLVDGLLAAQIEPWVTLYHWDLPQRLQDRGGWPARDTALAFADYAEVVARSLGDRVKHWMTLNEPWVVSVLGHLRGEHAPGHTSLLEATRTTHHLLLGHGMAAPVLRRDSAGCQVGIVLSYSPVHPASDREEDILAATIYDGLQHRMYLDPLAGRSFPADAVEAGDLRMDMIGPGDMATIAAPIDFLGLNNYTRNVVAHTPGGSPREIRVGGVKRTEMDWEVYPEGMYEMLMRITREYPFTSLYITENGVAFPDSIGPGGKVEDPRRVEYLRGYLAQAARAIKAGAPLKGYFVWSLLDNFEWAFGFSKRFGLVYVNYEDQQRIPKTSAAWYRQVIATNSLDD